MCVIVSEPEKFLIMWPQFVEKKADLYFIMRVTCYDHRLGLLCDIRVTDIDVHSSAHHSYIAIQIRMYCRYIVVNKTT